MMFKKEWAALVLSAFFATIGCAQNIDVSEQESSGGFPLVGSSPAALVFDAQDAEVVDVSVHLLAEDVERVTGRLPKVLSAFPGDGAPMVLVGTIGQSRFVDRLIATGKLDASEIEGQWESYVIAVVDQPFDGVEQALVIAGSDRRGTAYGVFTLSESMGVSPWYWWADVPAVKKKALYFSQQTIVQGPPSVKYRGIFINDEDWGLQPWSAKNFEPEVGDIGPKTYAKVFELLLRLKANYCWPAMHPCTRAFNVYADNKVVADRYAIVMGSSHCEPMLRNNVDEWPKDRKQDWNPVTNLPEIIDYWKMRVQENGVFENVYTVGMRGIHDGAVPGGGTLDQKRDRLESIINDQRGLIAEYVNDDPTTVPQIFCPYKEVLYVYQNGMELLDDITIVWPDDNHGYIRNLSTPEERNRAGRSGIYYHMSYWGAPQDYLWISTTSPAKIAYEMGKAYAYGADRLWVFNVGDIKPCEMEMEFALRLAYDVDAWPADKAMDFIEPWAARTFGAEHAKKIAAVYREYYRLNQRARPEHLEKVHFSEKEQAERLRVFAALSKAVEEIRSDMDQEFQDAFFQLVYYPVRGADLMNRKWAAMYANDGETARAAYDEIQELTREYNNGIADGKWNGMMSSAPRRLSVFKRPEVGQGGTKEADADPLVGLLSSDAECSGGMVVDGGAIVGAADGTRKEPSDAKAVFEFRAKDSGAADLYFLAQCIDENHDSWLVSVNGASPATINNNATGSFWRWLKIQSVSLQKGKNQLTVWQRESGTRIRAVALMVPGAVPPAPPEGDFMELAATDYASVKDGDEVSWTPVPGLGIESAAMTVFPYESRSLSKSELKQAPSITYALRDVSGTCTVEARFLPTHRINDGMGLRYAVQVDNGPVEIADINRASKSGDWIQNVLNGYSKGRTQHDVSRATDHKLTIYLLDPGMVLSQIRVFEQD